MASFLVLSLLSAACGGGASGDRKEYRLQGQVLSMQADHKQAVIRHEEIPAEYERVVKRIFAREP